MDSTPGIMFRINQFSGNIKGTEDVVYSGMSDLLQCPRNGTLIIFNFCGAEGYLQTLTLSNPQNLACNSLIQGYLNLFVVVYTFHVVKIKLKFSNILMSFLK